MTDNIKANESFSARDANESTTSQKKNPASAPSAFGLLFKSWLNLCFHDDSSFFGRIKSRFFLTIVFVPVLLIFLFLFPGIPKWMDEHGLSRHSSQAKVSKQALLSAQEQVNELAELFWNDIANANAEGLRKRMTPALAGQISAYGDREHLGKGGIEGVAVHLFKTMTSALDWVGEYGCDLKSNWLTYLGDCPQNGQPLYSVNVTKKHIMSGRCDFQSQTPALHDGLASNIHIQKIDAAWLVTDFSIRFGNELVSFSGEGVEIKRLPR